MRSAHKTLNTSLSEMMSQEIASVIPGGVDSPFRSFKEVGGHTLFISCAKGAKVFDIDGNSYIDYLGGWGPAILGHCPDEVVHACKIAIDHGAVFGAPHALELALAKELTELVPSLEKVRFVNSGTEAVMSAVRLARGYTGRDLLIMFEGCYHGHSDAVLCSRSHQASSGVPSAVAQNTLVVPFNDLNALDECIRAHSGAVACVLIEPVAGSMGVIPPKAGYLNGVAKLCADENILLIFDEVLTGLRVAAGGAQSLYGVRPDITCFGKALGGGMPIGAYGGKREIMDHLQPLGDVYQAGTFSGNPVTMAGGLETLKLMRKPGVYETLEELTNQLFEGLSAIVTRGNFPIQLQRVGSMFGIIFSAKPVCNFRDSLGIDDGLYAKFFHFLLEHGIYMPPSAVDAACVSAAHSFGDIEYTIETCDAAFSALWPAARDA